MLVYLDSVIVIYAVEGDPLFHPRAQTHIAGMRAAGDRTAVSDLVLLECRVKPLQRGDATMLADFDKFLNDPDVVWLPLPRAVYERAALIRAQYRYRLGDSLHLAAAVEGACGKFLTNDLRLSGFPDIPIEVLP